MSCSWSIRTHWHLAKESQRSSVVGEETNVQLSPSQGACYTVSAPSISLACRCLDPLTWPLGVVHCEEDHHYQSRPSELHAVILLIAPPPTSSCF